jgi:very-short-patch-repair endonuclease
MGYMKYNKWTLEKLTEEASKYQTIGQFKKNSPSAYQIAHRRGIIYDICVHMPKHVDQSGENAPHFRWTTEMLLEEANKYQTRSQFVRDSASAYYTALERGMLETVCSHMIRMGSTSLPETELLDWIKTIYPNARKNRDRNVFIKNKDHIKAFEIDIFIPELKLGIEFDGSWTHSFDGLKRGRSHWPEEDLRDYHQIKDSWFASKGIQILHIKEEDWNLDKEACIKRCLDFLSNSKKIKMLVA